MIEFMISGVVHDTNTQLRNSTAVTKHILMCWKKTINVKMLTFVLVSTSHKHNLTHAIGTLGWIGLTHSWWTSCVSINF
jgi:hypothetical protein